MGCTIRRTDGFTESDIPFSDGRCGVCENPKLGIFAQMPSRIKCQVVGQEWLNHAVFPAFLLGILFGAYFPPRTAISASCAP